MKKKWYQKNWVIILLLLIFSPIGIALLWVNKMFSPKTRKILSGVFAVYFVIMLIYGALTNDNTTQVVNNVTPTPIATVEPTIEPTEEPTPEPTEEAEPSKKPKKNNNVKHRKGDEFVGISDKNIDNIDSLVFSETVRNDNTGKWRLARIADTRNIEEYALSYYHKYFKNDNEIHAIVNFTNGTTTNISVIGDMLDITIHEYINKEEHDANLLFSGMVLAQYFVYLDNGDIEKIE